MSSLSSEGLPAFEALINMSRCKCQKKNVFKASIHSNFEKTTNEMLIDSLRPLYSQPTVAGRKPMKPCSRAVYTVQPVVDASNFKFPMQKPCPKLLTARRT